MYTFKIRNYRPLRLLAEQSRSLLSPNWGQILGGGSPSTGDVGLRQPNFRKSYLCMVGDAVASIKAEYIFHQSRKGLAPPILRGTSPRLQIGPSCTPHLVRVAQNSYRYRLFSRGKMTRR